LSNHQKEILSQGPGRRCALKTPLKRGPERNHERIGGGRMFPHDAREQVTSVYRETTRTAWLEGKPGRRVEAVCYTVDRSHPQYAGRLTLEQQLHHVRQGHGRSGNNRDYVIETVAALEALGCRDASLHLLAERLKGPHEAPHA
jgi:cation transport regulator ChaC